MARRGIDHEVGPLKPVGLIDPKSGKEPYAVVQLRQDDSRDFFIIWLVFKHT